MSSEFDEILEKAKSLNSLFAQQTNFPPKVSQTDVQQSVRPSQKSNIKSLSSHLETNATASKPNVKSSKRSLSSIISKSKIEQVAVVKKLNPIRLKFMLNHYDQSRSGNVTCMDLRTLLGNLGSSQSLMDVDAICHEFSDPKLNGNAEIAKIVHYLGQSNYRKTSQSAVCNKLASSLAGRRDAIGELFPSNSTAVDWQALEGKLKQFGFPFSNQYDACELRESLAPNGSSRVNKSDFIAFMSKSNLSDLHQQHRKQQQPRQGGLLDRIRQQVTHETPLKEIFDRHDKNKVGCIDLCQMSSCLQQAGIQLSKVDIDELLNDTRLEHHHGDKLTYFEMCRLLNLDPINIHTNKPYSIGNDDEGDGGIFASSRPTSAASMTIGVSMYSKKPEKVSKKMRAKDENKTKLWGWTRLEQANFKITPTDPLVRSGRGVPTVITRRRSLSASPCKSTSAKSQGSTHSCSRWMGTSLKKFARGSVDDSAINLSSSSNKQHLSFEDVRCDQPYHHHHHHHLLAPPRIE